MLALRGRYHPTHWRNLPKIWPQGFSGPMNREAFQDRIGFGIRLMAFSSAGAIVGQSVGYVLGAWRSSQIMKRDGNIENIERVLLKVKKDIEDEFHQVFTQDGGAGRMSSTQRRKLQGQPQYSQSSDSSGLSSDVDFYSRSSRDGLEKSRLARSFEKDEFSSNSAEKAWGETSFTKDPGTGPSMSDNSESFPSATGIPDFANSQKEGTSKRSRWEELRGTRRSQDSAWEKIRQDNARRQYNDKQRSSSTSNVAYMIADDHSSSETFLEEQRRAEDEKRKRQDKERQRLEYEKMFEKESRGEDSM